MFKNFLISIFILLTFSVMGEPVLLTEKNHVVLNGEVTVMSVNKISVKLLKLSTILKPTDTIYVFINSGGGSVYAGIQLINVMNAIPQKIVTISSFAFSMAYSISQRGDRRLIMPNGIMGQHRAKGSFSGQFGDGEVEKRLALWKSIVKSLNTYEAKRMSISLKEFRRRTKDEMYVFDKQAVDNKVADGIADIKCSKDLITKTRSEIITTFYGTSKLTYSKCPLINGPIKIEQVKESKHTKK